jgi:valyl-tRNA synthetase
MVMLGLRFTQDVPFQDVYVHSVIQAPDGRRMSKSLGTGIDPLEEIDRHGADAVRFGLLAMSSTQDVRFSAEKIRQGQALANKLFNAARLILMTVGPDAQEAAPRPQAVEDRWIVSRLQSAKADAARRIAEFDFAKLSLGLYDFVYGELCDWYLELIKGRELDESLSATLLYVLRETLLLTHPVTPFVTEEIWAEMPGTEGLLAQARRSAVDDSLLDAEAEAQITELVDAVRAIRAWREETGVRDVLVARADGFAGTREALARMARLEWGAPEGDLLDLGGVFVAAPEIDAAELERKRGEERARLQAEIDRARAKLANESFVAKAPEAVVGAEREKLAALQAQLEELG